MVNDYYEKEAKRILEENKEVLLKASSEDFKKFLIYGESLSSEEFQNIVSDLSRKMLQDKKIVRDHIRSTGSLKNFDESKLNGKLVKPL